MDNCHHKNPTFVFMANIFQHEKLNKALNEIQDEEAVYREGEVKHRARNTTSCDNHGKKIRFWPLL